MNWVTEDGQELCRQRAEEGLSGEEEQPLWSHGREKGQRMGLDASCHWRVGEWQCLEFQTDEDMHIQDLIKKCCLKEGC